MSKINFYDLLEVNPRASEVVIQAAYLALLNTHKEGKNKELLSCLEDAKDCLLDKKKRSDYDEQLGKLDGKIIGGFKVLSKIAQGAIGVTYKGEHVLTGLPVCIKHCSMISVEHDAIMINEARAMGSLRHFAIPTMHDLLRLDDGSLALVMSFVEGPTLEQLVERRGRMDAEHVAWICERALNALKCMHFHGIVHGDLKPQNMIIQHRDHTIVLVDFGLSQIRPKESTLAIGHTDYFSPPEQVEGSPLIPETDFYSLGMTMLYALSGGMRHVAKKEVPDTVPQAMCDFIGRLITKETLHRPNWEKEDLCETVKEMRLQAFGRSMSHMKKLDL